MFNSMMFYHLKIVPLEKNRNKHSPRHGDAEKANSHSMNTEQVGEFGQSNNSCSNNLNIVLMLFKPQTNKCNFKIIFDE